MNVAAIIVTRGDHEDEVEDQILYSLPEEWEVLLWDNGRKALYRYPPPNAYWNVPDLSVYGRYAAIEYTDAELIYVQDDDCVVSDPQAIVRAWKDTRREGLVGKSGVLNLHVETENFVACNMPSEFRHDFYEEHALVGFGACFHRDAPERAFEHFAEKMDVNGLRESVMRDTGLPMKEWPLCDSSFQRTCDIVFTALTPRVLVDVPVENLEWYDAPDRMWKQPTHMQERTKMLELVKLVRDGQG